MPETHDINLEFFDGKIRKVTHINADEMRVTVSSPEGIITNFTMTAGNLPEVGNIIALTENNFFFVSASLWPTENDVGVVREILGDSRILIEANHKLNPLSNNGLDVKPGQTVEYNKHNGVISILSDKPIRANDRDNEHSSDVSRYKMPDSDDGLKFSDFGGYPDVIARAKQLIETQIERGDLIKKIGAEPVKGVLFTGPPGTGKTYLAKIIANESDADFYLVSGPEIVGKWVGESEEKLRNIFEAAQASERKKAIIFFDEIDSIAEKRTDHSHEASRRLVAQLLTLMDGFADGDSSLIIIAATNREHALDPALTRPGRFDWKIEFKDPNLDDRVAILRAGQKQMAAQGYIPIEDLAMRSEGWSAADLSSLWTESALIAANDQRDFLCGEDVVRAFEVITKRRQREARVRGGIRDGSI